MFLCGKCSILFQADFLEVLCLSGSWEPELSKLQRATETYRGEEGGSGARKGVSGPSSEDDACSWNTVSFSTRGRHPAFSLYFQSFCCFMGPFIQLDKPIVNQFLFMMSTKMSTYNSIKPSPLIYVYVAFDKETPYKPPCFMIPRSSMGGGSNVAEQLYFGCIS